MQSKAGFNEWSSEQFSAARLLLLTARSFLEADEIDEVKTLSHQIADWDELAEIAVRKLSAPYLYRALSNANPGNIPNNAMERLREFTRFTKLRGLKLASALLQFHEACIEPMQVNYAYIKGLALSTQFGGNFADRYCRDIDVLVDEREFEHVILRAVEKGYRVVINSNPLKFAQSKNDLLFVTKFLGDVGLMSEDDVLIEVHRRLDKSSSIFKNKLALNSTEPFTLQGNILQTLEQSLHFTYICYHHSRHLWSHLHWLADLDMVVRSRKIEPNQLKETAAHLGLSPTVEGSIEFYHLLSQPSLWNKTDKKNGLANRFLDACLMNLRGGLELELELRHRLFSHDLMTKSQLSPDKLFSTVFTDWKSKFQPVSNQYAKTPLPAALFWLYRIQRPFLTWGDRLERLISKRERDL